MDFNIRLVSRIIGLLLVLEAVLIGGVCVGVAWYYNETVLYDFLNAGVVTAAVGLVMSVIGWRSKKDITRREGAVIVTLSWLVFCFFGMLPFLTSATIPRVVDAWFETMSGFTTTGASVVENLEQWPRSMLFWRSLMQWSGGLGIIVICLALLPTLGFRGMQLFGSDIQTTPQKVSRRISESSRQLFLIYIVLTIVQTVCLRLADMGWFDAVNHSMTTIATAGFSTRQASIAAYNSPLIEYIIVLFMFLSGVNFTLYYLAFTGTHVGKLVKNDEFKAYVGVVLIFTLILFLTTTSVWDEWSWRYMERHAREALFQAVSLITTTGYATADYMTWPSVSLIAIYVSLLFGACYGSTSGGIKVSRVAIAFKYCYNEIRRMVRPNMVNPIVYAGNTLRTEQVARVFSFIVLYVGFVAVGTMVLGLSGMGLEESVGSMASCLATDGPGMGMTGPAASYAGISDFAKWFLSGVMLVGRMDLFIVLLLFTPAFWRK